MIFRFSRNQFGLSTKIAFVTTLSFVLMMFILTTTQLWLFKNNLQETLFAEQNILTNSVSQNLNQQLTTLKIALTSSARAITEADMVSSDTAQKYLDTNAGLNAIFERSVFLFSPSGKLVAEHPYLPKRRGQDFSWRDYNREAIRTRGPVISEPFITTKADRHVVIMFATPVFSKNGKDIIAINTGSFGLTNPRLLANIDKTVIGKTGFMYIVNKDGLLVMHPDKSLLLKRPYEKGKNPLFDQALSGFEGTGKSIERDGRTTITTFKKIPSTGWILASVYPEDEAFESFNQLVRNLAIIFSVSALLACALVWFLSRGLVLKIQSKNEILKRLRAESLNQLRTKNQFFNEASHDFRQRLHGMQLLINASGRNGVHNVSTMLTKVKSAVADLQRYLDSFLEITRLETITVQPAIKKVMLQDVFQRLELQFEESAENQKVNLKFRYTEIILYTDEKMLVRILENLISNAIKFSNGKALVAARCHSGGITIMVCDNGKGIPEEDKEKVFFAFFQSKNTANSNISLQGVGLGLSIVTRLVNVLNAKITVDSKLERGTIVRVAFPFAHNDTINLSTGASRPACS